jgi:hypothetical protein
MISETDLRRLYAKINAQDAILRACLRGLISIADDKAEAFEFFRSTAMDFADSLNQRDGDPNPDFTDEGRLETLTLVSEFLESERPSK